LHRGTVVFLRTNDLRNFYSPILSKDMTRVIATAAVGVLCGVMAVGARGASRPDFSGAWTLNHDLSELPREVGFDPNWHDPETGTQTSTGRSGGGGRGGRGGGGSGNGGGSSRIGNVPTVFESEEDSRKIRELVDEVKGPPERLTITQTDAAVTIADARGRARTVHPGGKQDTLDLDAGPVSVTAKWENAQLVIRCLIEKDRELRYRYSREPGTDRLVIEVQFADHGHGALIKRVYDAAPRN
jgi:hypothetical protein